MGEVIGVAELFRDADRVAARLDNANAVYGLRRAHVVFKDQACVVLELTLDPWRDLAARMYPRERVRLAAWRTGRLLAIPDDRLPRQWQHRVPFASSPFRELCLWHPRDPRSLRWEWDDGLVAFITIVHRHLQAEEYRRRHGAWPAEDAPHGPRYAPPSPELLAS